jgi:hypothetical protein
MNTKETLPAYQITVQGKLEPKWSKWLENATMVYDHQGNTILTLRNADQSALRGFMNKLWDVNLSILSVCRENN